MIYPWFEPVINSLDQALQTNHLAHALLFESKEGLGIDQLLIELAKGLVCHKHTTIKACGSCRDCRLWLDNELHPDVFEVQAIDDVIRIDQIRSLKEKAYLTAHNHANGNQKASRVIMIKKLECLNEASANALLKLLEEPPSNTYFLLATHRVDQLLKTILSRTQLIKVQASYKETTRWLKSLNLIEKIEPNLEVLWRVSYGKPLFLRSLIDELEQLQLRDELLALLLSQKKVYEFSEAIKDGELEKIIFWLYTLIGDIIRCKLSAVESVLHKDCLEKIQVASRYYSYELLMSRYDKLTEFNKALTKGYHLNKKLWLLDWFNYELMTTE